MDFSVVILALGAKGLYRCIYGGGGGGGHITVLHMYLYIHVDTIKVSTLMLLAEWLKSKGHQPQIQMTVYRFALDLYHQEAYFVFHPTSTCM